MMTIFLGKYCIRLEKIHSTNSYLADLCAEKSLPEGTVVIADEQEQGRGQRGTHWESEAGKNLTLSILLKPLFLKPEEQFNLSRMVSLAVSDFVFSLAPHPSSLVLKIKWPNDIYVGNRKIAGILIENSVSGNSISHSVVGIGINVNQEKFSVELPNPTSLKLETRKEFNLEDCLEKLCSCMEKRYLQLRNHSKEIDSDYLKNLYRFEEWAGYNYKGEKLKGKITGVTKIGKLVLEKENREMIECDFKEVGFILPSSSPRAG
jgi:BirA family biotin operon repressor/biotin-[acetyl-CoA-carboxylase] ligase